MDKVTGQCPQTTTFLKRKESRSGIEPRSFRLPAQRLTARPNRLTVIFATATVLAFVLLRNSSFNFHCYTQREATPTQKSARKCAATSRDFFAERLQSAFTLANQLRWIAHIALHLQAKAQAHNPCYQKMSMHLQTCEELSIFPPSNSCYSHSMHHTAQGKLVCKIPSMSMINFPTSRMTQFENWTNDLITGSVFIFRIPALFHNHIKFLQHGIRHYMCFLPHVTYTYSSS